MKHLHSEPDILNIPEDHHTLPLDPGIARQFENWGEMNLKTPLPVLRFMVHLATRHYSYKFYTGNFRSRYLRINHAGKKLGLRVITKESYHFPGAILYLHGGGGVFGSSAAYLKVLKNVAHFTKTCVIALDYSRGPENPFSVSLDEAAFTLNWIHMNASTIGINPQRIVVMGDSAGAALAATLCQYNRDHYGPKISAQILINPMTLCNVVTNSRRLFKTGFGLTQKQIEFFEHCWFEKLSSSDTAYSAPMDCRKLSGLPPALLITSEYDPLKDEGEAYARALHRAGNETKAFRFLGMGHAMVAFGCTRISSRKLYDCVQTYLDGIFISNS